MKSMVRKISFLIIFSILLNGWGQLTIYADSNSSSDNSAIEAEEKLWYSKKLPLKKEHQKLLWDYCQKRGLDYVDMLSLIAVESNFNEKCSTRLYKGYFQISVSNCKNLSKVLKTPNTPLDGAVNINWGTAIIHNIINDKRVKKLEGKKKRDVMLSIFQRGTRGYDQRGLSSRFLKAFYKKRAVVSSYFTE